MLSISFNAYCFQYFNPGFKLAVFIETHKVKLDLSDNLSNAKVEMGDNNDNNI